MSLPKITWPPPGTFIRDGFAIRGRRVAAYLMLTCVMGAVAAVSWSGLYAFATQEMGWSPFHATLFCLSLDIAAMTAALLALDRIEKGETGAQLRLIAAALVGLSAFINWRRALLTGNVAEELLFPAMSVIAYWLVHAVMGAIRRDVRRAQYGQEAKQRVAPLPRFGVLVWVPGIGIPMDALRAVRAAVRERLEDAVYVMVVPAAEPAVQTGELAEVPVGEPQPRRVSQSEAILLAMSAVTQQRRDLNLN